MALEVHPAALDEAVEATKYFAEIDPKLGRQFALAVEGALMEIAAHPLRAPQYRRTLFRRRVLAKFPYCVFYRVFDDGRVRVLAVATDRRRPGYWRRRA